MSVTADAYIDFRQRGGVADLSDRVKLRLTGADRVRYLNGQVTANVKRLTADQAIPSCVTTAKGRLCADVFISSTPESLIIDADPELRESLLARLERYIISDDAALEDATDDLSLLHVLSGANETITARREQEFAGLHPRVSRRFGPEGLDLLVPASETERILAFLTQPDPAAGAAIPSRPILKPDLLELLRIECGIPRWGRELGEDTLPPEAGLDLTHVDYQKGCYIGQEVISRLKSVGHVNRLLLGFVPASFVPGDSAPSLAVGMRLFTDAGEGKSVGNLTSTAYSFALAKPIALGYLRRDTQFTPLFACPAESAEPRIEVIAQNLPFVESGR